jgi:hypothetical protein
MYSKCILNKLNKVLKVKSKHVISFIFKIQAKYWMQSII